jgi:hypothetical protein
MQEPTKIIPLIGFDSDGEPELRVMPDGSLYLAFNFMPPSWAGDEPEPFDNFDQRLQQAIGVPVIWEDRELFLIQNPTPDTVERITTFLQMFE